MNAAQPERGSAENIDTRESQSAVDPDVLVQTLADQAEALIPQEGDSASALERVSEALRAGNDPVNLDQALTALEQQREWTPATRELALEISQLDQRERGEIPLNFGDAIDKLKDLGRDDIAELVRDLDSTDDSTQVEAIGGLLEIVEDLMASFPDVAGPGADKTQLQEYRSIRNALLLKQEELNIQIEKAEAEAYEALMGEEEEDDAQAKVQAAYQKARPKTSTEPLFGRESELDEQALVAKLDGLNPQELLWYENQNFQLNQRTRQQVPYLKAFVAKRLKQASTQIPAAGTRYSGSVTDIMGQTGEALNFLRLVTSVKRKGGMIAPNEFSKMQFADVARDIGLNVYLYDRDFDKRYASHL